MPVIFDVKLMQSDLSAFSKASSKFLANHRRLDNLQAQLATAVANAKQADGSVRWGTGQGEAAQPIRTRPSKSYRSHGEFAKELVAEVSFNFKGNLAEDDKDRLIVTSGGTSIKLMWSEGDGDCTECHFDVHPNKVGHPTLHIQFVGEVRELPRVPSFFAHPLDILEFTLMEVFQESWRRERSKVTCRTQLHTFPASQRTRLKAVLQKYTGWLDSENDTPPLVSLQATPAPPFDLYPQ
ncbi:hypothetical protein [Bradyrhizobium sp. USDA 4473]